MEVLVAVTLIGLVLSVALFTFLRGVHSSAALTAKNGKITEFANLFWDLTRAVYGAKRLYLRNGTDLYLVTTGGMFNPGVVQAAFLYRNGTLYYYEYPYPKGNIFDYERDKLIALYRLRDFQIIALSGGREFKNYDRKPWRLKVETEGRVFYLNF